MYPKSVVCYLSSAPKAKAIFSKLLGTERDGEMDATRRTETSTRAPSFSSRSRKVPSGPAHTPYRRPQAHLLQNTYAAAVSSTRNWFAKNVEQLVRSISSPSWSSLIRFSMSPRSQYTCG